MAEKKDAAKMDPMKIKQTKVVPYAPSGEQQNLFVGLNGKTYNIPRGQAVALPRAVWEVIERKMAAERKQEEELRRS